MLGRRPELVRRMDHQIAARPLEDRMDPEPLQDRALAVLTGHVDRPFEMGEPARPVQPEDRTDDIRLPVVQLQPGGRSELNSRFTQRSIALSNRANTRLHKATDTRRRWERAPARRLQRPRSGAAIPVRLA